MSNTWPIKYTPGSLPSKAKRKSEMCDKNEQDKRAKADSCEKGKRQQSFQDQWMTGRPWLVYDKEKGVM